MDLVNTASDSARVGTADETSGSREQERRQENGEAGKASGSGRLDTDGEGPSGSAVAGRPPGTSRFQWYSCLIAFLSRSVMHIGFDLLVYRLE